MNELETLKSLAGQRCIDIYNDFSRLEMEEMTTSIREAWLIGEAINLALDNEEK